MSEPNKKVYRSSHLRSSKYVLQAKSEGKGSEIQMPILEITE
jgi:hypothetical protein